MTPIGVHIFRLQDMKSRGREEKLKQKKADRRKKKKLQNMKTPHPFGGFVLAHLYNIIAKFLDFWTRCAHQLVTIFTRISLMNTKAKSFPRNFEGANPIQNYNDDSEGAVFAIFLCQIVDEFRGRHGGEKKRGLENLTNDTPPKKGFWTPSRTVRFPPL